MKLRPSLVVSLCALGASLFASEHAHASPLFELAGGTTGTGSFNARVTGAGAPSTYFNPALLPYADQTFELGVLVLSEQVSMTLDGRPSGNVPTSVRDPGLVDGAGQPVSIDTFPTEWLERGCPTCGDTGFRRRPRQAAGSSAVTRKYQIIGLVSQLIKKRLVLGFHALVPYGRFTTANSYYNDEREQVFSNSLHPELYGDRMTATSLSFGAGSELVDGLSLGVSFTLSLINTANAGAYVRDPSDYNQLYLSNNVGVEASVAPHFGVTWSPLDSLRLSAAFHTVQKFEIDVGFRATLSQGNESSTERTNVHDYLPWTLSAGGDWTLTPRATHRLGVAATASYAHWSSYIDRHGVSPKAEYGDDYAWHDVLSGAVGLRHAVGALRTFVDFTYVPTPVPAQTGRSNYVDNDRFGLSLGGDYTFEVGDLLLRPGLQLQGQRLIDRYQKKDDRQIIDEFDDSAHAPGGPPLAAAQGLQTNNPGWPGFASAGWIYGGSASLALLY